MPGATDLVTLPGADSIGKAIQFTARAKYDFAVDGGLVGDINLLPSALIPAGSIILAAFVRITTPPTSGGAATIALKVEGAGDLQAATAFDGAPYSVAGIKPITKTFGTAPILTTAARNIVATIAVAALTGGVLEVDVLFLPPGL